MGGPSGKRLKRTQGDGHGEVKRLIRLWVGIGNLHTHMNVSIWTNLMDAVIQQLEYDQSTPLVVESNICQNPYSRTAQRIRIVITKEHSGKVAKL